jgi:hypothetical protein
MKIQLQKFGTTLISRELGSEAFKAFQPVLRGLLSDEELKIDFGGVLTLSSSWADEFLTPLLDRLKDQLVLIPSNNLSVKATIKILERSNKKRFKIQS